MLSVVPLSALALDFGASAAPSSSGGGKYDTVGDSLRSIVDDIFNPLIALIIALGLIVFLWGVVKYVTAGADESKAKEGRDLMVYGIIALTVMVSVWSLVNVLRSSFHLSDTNAPAIPKIGK